MDSRIRTAVSAGTSGSVRQELHGRIGMAASARHELPDSICSAGSERQHLQVRQELHGKIGMAESVW